MKTDDINAATEHILALRNYPRKPAYLAAALEDIFAHFGHIPEAAKPLLSSYFNVTVWPGFLNEHLLHAATANQRCIKVCEGPCCKNAGSDQLAEAVNTELHASVERHHCMGSCQNAPAVMIDGKLIAEASLTKIENLLKQL